MMAGGNGSKLEHGTFTLLNDTKTYTINHNLGAVPDFCIVYPIDVPTASSAYRMCYECMLFVGQEDYNISTRDNSEFPSPHVMWYGTGYALNAPSATPVLLVKNNYAGQRTTTTIVVGGVNDTNSAGTLSPGTYGYILGKLSN